MTSNPVDGPRSVIPARSLHEDATTATARTAGAHTGCQCHHRPALLAAKRLSRVPKDPLGRMFLANAQPYSFTNASKALHRDSPAGQLH
ncbi:hypothetical protein HBI70_204770 [Parastagonospora nodorum]|nr:hypothetical protein HBH51_176410 [Parastagonospora nodorum]KAH4059876.1 hypothetical protein HBH49_025270 [Parastagonospora nodorum]KAH5251875.1 hypothetical protein HBI70_204770 [Parastagonospora nodorum]KAH5757154.1 hypothetical protein HBI16_211210 [Parastagonospora nodorum]KAH6416399.1 hypothetical protein HBI14_114060 [Parastagonospora nodorum]